jgi:probable rRNA maturation factor
MPDIAILREGGGWDALAHLDALVEKAALAACDAAGLPLRPGAELSILLTDDTALRSLNAQWRQQDKPTNVLSFPAVPVMALATSPVIGDVALAFETIAREAEEQAKPLADHVLHLVVHGVLHCLGHDHMNPEEAEVMEALERRILAGLGIADPYTDPLPVDA